MDKEYLVQKWFAGTLTPEENEAFMALPEYPDYQKISKKAVFFKAPSFNNEAAYANVAAIKNTKATPAPLLKWWYAAAAILIAGALFFWMSNTPYDTHTEIAQQSTITLPDGSIVQLNASSDLTYSKNNWDEERLVNLKGEAYFKVASGKRFDVKTTQGIVSVLGTQFNVKDREGYFEVKTFEGLVTVKYKDSTLQLPAGQTITIINGVFQNGTTQRETPNWTQGTSTFTSIPLKEVLDELQRQYKISLKFTNLPLEQKFTGSFTHKNLNLALQSITIPMGLTYTQKDGEVIMQYSGD